MLVSYADFAARVRQTVQGRPERGHVVAVDGWSGAGKTMTAIRLASELQAPLIAMDDFVPGWDGLAASVDLLADWVLRPLAAGQPAAWRVWNWQAARFGDTRNEDPAPIVVVEGCGSGSARVRPLLAALVWIETSAALRRTRLQEREDWDLYEEQAERWERQEEQLRAGDDVAGAADWIVDGDRSPLPGTPGTAGDHGVVLLP